MVAGLCDPALYRYLPDLPPTDVEDLRSRYGRISGGRSPGGADRWCNWIVRRDVDRCCVGTVQATMSGIAGQTKRVLIGYMILPAFWRQGYGRASVATMLECLFGAYRCRVAEALVDTRNQASLALLAGLGFRIVGRNDDADFFAGETSHEFELELAAADWKGGAPA